MSRDFRPIELYAADRRQNLRNMKLIYCVNGTETEITHGTEESRRLYPETTFLLSNQIDQILKDIPEEILKKCEESIKRAEDEFLPKDAEEKNGAFQMKGSFYTEDAAQKIIESIEEGKHTDMDDAARAWFLGQLDPGFYYGEENEDRFVKHLHNCKKELIQEKKKSAASHRRGR